MNWLNINVATLRSAEYIGSEPVARATWLNVLGWCCMQENAGRIANCRGWRDRQWQQICGVTADEVNASSPLLFWEGDDLVVWNYPVHKEAEVAAKREGGRNGGLRSGASRREAMLEAELEAETKLTSNGKERKGKEGEEKEKGKGSGRIVAEVSATSDADWLKQLQSNAAYQSLDVQREFAKMSAWCSINRKHPTRRRFVNWLNRAEKPISNVQSVSRNESFIDRS